MTKNDLITCIAFFLLLYDVALISNRNCRDSEDILLGM